MMVVEKMFRQTGGRIDLKKRMQAKRVIRIDNTEIKGTRRRRS